MKSQPPHFGGSLILSAKTFGYALGSGFGGIVLQPKRGEFLIYRQRHGLNIGVPMDRSIQIIGSKFRQELNTEMVPFSTRLILGYFLTCPIISFSTFYNNKLNVNE